MSISKFKKGDEVMVAKGKDRGKTGNIVSINKDYSRAIVEGINVYKKHAKPSNKYPQGGIIDMNVPVKTDNLALICKTCKKTTRVKVKNEGKDKRRICVKCGEVVDVA